MFTPNNSIDKCTLMLDLAAHRQRALAGNVSNIDTPGYVRKDVDFSQYLGSMNSPLETKLSEKLGPSAVIQDTQGQVDQVYELTEMHKTAIIYKTAIKRMSATLSAIKTVINVGS
jgi:flagellar basal-body rod protein FlgB